MDSPLEAHSSEQTPPRWTEKEVRRLLKLLKRPHFLKDFPLAVALAQAFGSETPQQAVIQTIEETFKFQGLVGKRLRDLLWHCDVEASVTQEAAASEMHLSPRQFFRYRAEAVSALVGFINAKLGASSENISPLSAMAQLLEDIDPAATVRLHALSRSATVANPSYVRARVRAGDDFDDLDDADFQTPEDLLTLAQVATAKELHGDRKAARAIVARVRDRLSYRSNHLRSEIEFALSSAEFAAARHSGSAPSMQAAANRLRAIRQQDESLTLGAMLCEAEAEIAAGQWDVADGALGLVEKFSWEKRSVVHLGIATLRRAQALFAAGLESRAQEIGTAARLVLRRLPDEDFQCSLLLGRVNLLLGLLHEVAPHPFAQTSWNGAYANAIAARYAVANGDMEQAARVAQSVAAVASAQGYRAIEAWNATTLASIAAERGDAELSTERLQAAATGLWELKNQLLARDLFLCAGLKKRDFGPFAYDARFETFMFEALAALHPRFRALHDAAARKVVAEVVRKIAFGALRLEVAGESFGLQAQQCARILGSALDENGLRRQGSDFIHDVAELLGATLPYDMRAGFKTTVHSAFGDFWSRVCRNRPLGVEVSQSA